MPISARQEDVRRCLVVVLGCKAVSVGDAPIPHQLCETVGRGGLLCRKPVPMSEGLWTVFCDL